MKINFKNKIHSQALGERGFTLIEVMISVGLFTVLMVIGIGAILAVSSTNRRTQAMRSIIDNLSFVMEDMARSMRLGDYFVCKDSLNPITFSDVWGLNSDGAIGQLTQDGEDCKSIAFEPYWNFSASNPENQIIYQIGNGAILKKNEQMSFIDIMDPITPVEVNIDSARSGFTVTGSSKPADDFRQPKINIVLTGTITVNGKTSEFNMQTSVSQRSLDVDAFN